MGYNRAVNMAKKDFKKYQGQSTLESTIALIAAVVLLLGITQVFVWVNKMMVERQRAYQSTRMSAYPQVEFYKPKNLDIFGTQGGQ